MNDWFLEPYLKLNLLLAAAFMLWLLTKHCARLCGFEVGQARQLAIARALFLGFLLAAPLLWLLHQSVPLFAALGGWAPEALVAGEMSVSAYMDDGLDRAYQVGSLAFSMSAALLALLLAGLAVQAVRFVRQWRNLRDIVEGSLEIRAIRGIRILVSEDIGTPFSTRALGRNDVVLPARLLVSPRNFRIALKHELQHLRNGDLHWVIFIEALKLLCFWNPAAHAWHGEFDSLQEFACDEVLVGRRRLKQQVYGDCLLEVATASSRDILPASSNMVPRFSLLRTSQSQLKRRIVMMSMPCNGKFQNMKAALYGGIFCTGLGLSSLAVLAQPEEEAEEERREYLPIVTIRPQYPTQALEQKLVGWVLVSFTVTEEGAVAEPRVVDSCAAGPAEIADEEYECLDEYEDVFSQSSLHAIERFRFNPRLEGGAPVRTAGVQYVFRYNLTNEDGSVSRMPGGLRVQDRDD